MSVIAVWASTVTTSVPQLRAMGQWLEQEAVLLDPRLADDLMRLSSASRLIFP
jgi:hypothetical protein